MHMFRKMKKKIEKTHSKMILILATLLFGLGAIAQEAPKSHVFLQKELISFGESLSKIPMHISDDCDWKIIEKTAGKTLQSGRGESLKEHVFDTPGNYLIELILNENHKHNSCSHGAGQVNIALTVSPTKMVYDFSKVTFSAPIKKGVNTQNITMTLPISVSIFDKQPIRYALHKVTTAGIETEIIATPVAKDIILSEGTQVLTYRLSGIAHKEAYIMFDFVDCNNQIQSYSLLDPIK